MANAFVRSCFRQHSCFAFHQKLTWNGYYVLKRRAHGSQKFLVYIKTAHEVYSKQYRRQCTIRRKHHLSSRAFRGIQCGIKIDASTLKLASRKAPVFSFFLLKARNGLPLLELPLMTMYHHCTHPVHNFHAAKHAETEAGDRPVKFRLKTLKLGSLCASEMNCTVLVCNAAYDEKTRWLALECFRSVHKVLQHSRDEICAPSTRNGRT